ncbi:hypothetical protein ACELLULO517_25370 [Acidisoma cellulosilytica]|uniref:Glycosyl hydrolase-like 10 domain-containing protein n=1 Tax=Acidisoma cellulosilyticum TaxID=2802395 RepID=A0A964E6H7_9PROT|nr:hypothetical protein [Acidisoma cellulosilyticum]MCB8883604.1 hypothetical protein [Acidisoma cellulosilyticum]
MDLRSGVKIYDNDWFIRHQLEPEEAADLLVHWNVTYVIAQSRWLPMQDSAVTSAVTAAQQARYAALDDLAFRRALAARGIAYIAVLNIGFDPVFAAAHPDLLPIDQHGQRAQREDWYIGLPPNRQANTDHKIGLLTRAVAELAPDGVHLGFVRWPGFWETWLAGDDPAGKPHYCFSAETLAAFTASTGIRLPTDDPAAALAEADYRAAWTAWKCQQTVSQIAAIRQAIAGVRPDLPIAINTLPFFRDEFEGAVETVFGQDIAALSPVVDIFEVMAYHQILRQPADWPGRIAADILGRSQSAAICTIQARALYLDGQHAGRGRATEITAEDFGACLDGIAASPVQGVCVFTFTDLLDMRDEAQGQEMLAHLRRFRL